MDKEDFRRDEKSKNDTSWRNQPSQKVSSRKENWREPRRSTNFHDKENRVSSQRQNYSRENRGTPNFHRHVETIPAEEFERFFHFQKQYEQSPDWVLPNVSRAYSSTCYEFEDFQNMKKDLANVKEEVRETFEKSLWQEITNKSSLNEYIVKYLKRNNMGHVVKNWTKGYEMFSKYPIVSSGQLNSIHIGDRSGGIIKALNHFLHSNFEDTVDWKWKAICDNPYYEGGNPSKR